MSAELVIYTTDGRVRYVDPDSVKLVGRWGRKWLAAVDSEDPVSSLIALDEVVAIEQDDGGAIERDSGEDGEGWE